MYNLIFITESSSEITEMRKKKIFISLGFLPFQFFHTLYLPTSANANKRNKKAYQKLFKIDRAYY